MNIYLTYEGTHQTKHYFRLNYESKYSTGSIPIKTPQDLITAIEEVCGKGSYCLYTDKTSDYPKAVGYNESKNLTYPTITYWQQGVKTAVIEQCRKVAYEIWGDIPEMKIGWLEKQCQSYIEDLNIDYLLAR